MCEAINLTALNGLDRTAFIACLGGIFEHSPWVAEKVWAERPFISRAALHAAMFDIVQQADHELQLTLIRAHPELAGKAAEQGLLTRASNVEQTSAGLHHCTAEELNEIRDLNQAYQEKFGFPFIMAVKERTKEDILQTFRVRLQQTPDQAFKQSLEQIGKIAQLRLNELIKEP